MDHMTDRLSGAPTMAATTRINKHFIHLVNLQEEQGLFSVWADSLR